MRISVYKMEAYQFEEVQKNWNYYVLAKWLLTARVMWSGKRHFESQKSNPITESRSKREKRVFVSDKTLATPCVLCT